MAWDKTKPAGSTKVRLGDELIRENWDCLDDGLARNHTFPGEKGSTAGEHTVIELVDQAGDPSQEAGMIKIQNNAGALRVVYPGGSALPMESVPTGEIIVFEKDTAVSGFTLKTDKDDFLMFITKGSGAGGETGGSDHSTGTWTQPDHTLTVAETGLPSHSHTYSKGYNPKRQSWGGSFEYLGNNTVGTTSSVGGSGAVSAHNHGTTWRPKARNFTRQEKN